MVINHDCNDGGGLATVVIVWGCCCLDHLVCPSTVAASLQLKHVGVILACGVQYEQLLWGLFHGPNNCGLLICIKRWAFPLQAFHLWSVELSILLKFLYLIWSWKWVLHPQICLQTWRHLLCCICNLTQAWYRSLAAFSINRLLLHCFESLLCTFCTLQVKMSKDKLVLAYNARGMESIWKLYTNI